MKIDIKIRHVTKPGANLFLELGFPPEEAKRLQAASRKQIYDTRLLKRQSDGGVVCLECKTWLETVRGRRNPDGFAPACADVVNKKTAKFTIDTLVEMLSRAGKPVRLAIG